MEDDVGLSTLLPGDLVRGWELNWNAFLYRPSETSRDLRARFPVSILSRQRRSQEINSA
jgi:hypothetical protein